jgi:hypothetical protein
MGELQVISRINKDFYDQFTKYDKYYVLPTSFFDFMDDTEDCLKEIKLQKEKLQDEKLREEKIRRKKIQEEKLQEKELKKKKLKESIIMKIGYDEFINTLYNDILKKLKISNIDIVNIFNSIVKKIQFAYEYKIKIYGDYLYDILYKYKKFNKIDKLNYKFIECYETYNKNILLNKNEKEQFEFINIIIQFEKILSNYVDKIIFMYNEIFKIKYYTRNYYIIDLGIKHMDKIVNTFFNRNKHIILF